MNGTRTILSLAALLAFAVMLPRPSAAAETAAEWARKGVGEYEGGKLDEAVKSFQKAAELDPDDAKIQYNLGTALSKQGNHADAIKALERSLSGQNFKGAGSPRFNLGYTRVNDANKKADGDPNERMKGLREGLEDFKQAILDNPADRDAKFNFEATKLLLKQLQQQMQQQSQGKGGKSDDKKKSDDHKTLDGEQQGEENQGEGKDDKKGDQSLGQQGKDGKTDGQGGEDQKQQEKDQQKDGEQKDQGEQDEKKDGKQGDQSNEGQTQEKGLESTPTPKPQDGKGDEKKQGQGEKPDAKLTPKPEKSQPQQPKQGAPGGQSEGEPKAEPLTKEQLDALRTLNVLEQEKPEQFKKLFRFQGKGTSKRPERPW